MIVAHGCAARLQLGAQCLHGSAVHRHGIHHSRRGVPRVKHVGGNAPAQAVHPYGRQLVALRHTPHTRRFGGRQNIRFHYPALYAKRRRVHTQFCSKLCRRRAGLYRRLFRFRLQEFFHILQRYAPLGAGTFHETQLDTFFPCQLFRRRRGDDRLSAPAFIRRLRGRRGLRLRRCRSFVRLRTAGYTFAFLPQIADDRLAGRRFAGGKQDLEEHPLRLGLHVICQLVRGNGEQRVSLFYIVAFPELPFLYRALRHGKTQLRHQYLVCHQNTSCFW